VTIDTYRYPALRRLAFGLFRAEAWLRDGLHALRRANHWTVGAVLVGVVFVVERQWPWGVAFAVALMVTVVTWVYERIGERNPTMAAVDAMSGWEFERWLGKLYEGRGFAVEQTPYSGDYGADLILTWNGLHIAVQSKSGHQNAGVKAVQEVHAAKTYYGCDKAVVVTNQYFTEQALLLAEKLGVRMRHRGDLTRMIVEHDRRKK
jgi:restriction system protein